MYLFQRYSNFFIPSPPFNTLPLIFKVLVSSIIFQHLTRIFSCEPFLHIWKKKKSLGLNLMNTMRTEPIWSAIREILWLQLKKCERMHCHDKIKSWLFYMTETKKLMNISVWNFNSSSVLELVENYINSICHFGVRLRTSRTFLVFLIFNIFTIHIEHTLLSYAFLKFCI